MPQFIHKFVPSRSGSDLTLLGLHGTGGDESEILRLVSAIGPEASMLSARGKSTDEGVNRFFRRLAEGVFDMRDLEAKTKELGEWLEWAKVEYGVKKLIAVGYSNGANIATSLLFMRPELLDGVIGLRGMTAYVDESAKLTGKPVLLLTGDSDPIVPHEDVQGLADKLRAAGADVDHEWLATGHGLTQQDIMLARAWLAKRA